MQQHTWSFIGPWCAHLRGCLVLEARRDPASHSMRHRDMRLHVTLPPDGKGTNWRRIQDLREAVELLGAVTRIDHAALRDLLVHACGIKADAVEKAMGSTGNGDPCSAYSSKLLPHVTFAFAYAQYESLDISWGATLYNQFFLALDYASLSSAFHNAMARVRALEQRHQPLYRTLSASSMTTHGPRDRIHVELAFATPTLPTHWCAPYLQSVLEVVHAIRDESDCSTSGSGHAFPFVLHAVQLAIDRVVLSNATMPLVRELLALGVAVPMLSLDSSAAIMTSPRVWLGQFIIAMTDCATACNSSFDADAVDYDATSAYRNALKPSSYSLHLQGPQVSAQHLSAFCSALASAKRIASVRVSAVVADDIGAARFAKWQWLAFAFLCPRQAAQSHVSSLHIDDTSLCDDDVRAIASVVLAAYPATAFGSSNSNNNNNIVVDPAANDDYDSSSDTATTKANSSKNNVIVSVLLEKGTQLAVEPQQQQDQSSTFVLDADDHFLVMRDDPASAVVDVLVPGYARCAVARDAVLYYVSDTETLETTTTTRQSLNTQAHASTVSTSTPPLHSSSDAHAGITSLHLAFRHIVDVTTLQAFLALVGAPLESLVLQTRAMTHVALDTILRTCRRLQRLSLDMVEDGTLAVLVHAYAHRRCAITSLSLQGLELESDEVTAFAHALGTRGSALATTLQELSIGERLESYALDEANLLALLAMLETNTRLESLELYVEYALFNNFAPLFHEFDGQALPVTDRPMPLQSRLAFLSVLSCSETVTTDCADERATKRRRSSGNSSLVQAEATQSSPFTNAAARRSASIAAFADTSKIDSHVAALIFAFAAAPKKRVVRIVGFC